MWQYTSNGRLPSYAGRLDINIFYGNKNDWQALTTGQATNNQTQQEQVGVETTFITKTNDVAYFLMQDGVKPQ